MSPDRNDDPQAVQAFQKWVRPWDERGQHPLEFQTFIGGWECAMKERKITRRKSFLRRLLGLGKE
jgi:hypothetical protein